MTLAGFFSITCLLSISWWLSSKNLMNGFLLVVFLTPWVGVSLSVGLELRASQIVLLPLVALTLLRSGHSKTRPQALNEVWWLRVFLGVSIFWTLAQIPFLPEANILGGWARQPVPRSLFQIPMLILTYLPAIIAPRIVRNSVDIYRIGKVYIISLLILALLGWVQLGIWRASGVDIFPVGLVNQLLGGGDEDIRYGGAYGSGNFMITRITSLAGEPKVLGSLMATGMLLLQISFTVTLAKKSNTRVLLYTWAIMAITLFLTLSTTGMVLYAIGCVGHILGIMISKKAKGNTRNQMITRYIGLAGVAIIMIGGMEMSGIPVNDLIFERTTQRFQEQGTVLEDFNEAISDFLIDNPQYGLLGVGLGNIHLYADRYLSAATAAYGAKTPFTAKSTYLRLISETGIVSLVLLLTWCAKVYFSIQNMQQVNKQNQLSIITNQALLVMVLLYFSAGYVVGPFILMAGVASSVCNFSPLRVTLPVRLRQNNFHGHINL